MQKRLGLLCVGVLLPVAGFFPSQAHASDWGAVVIPASAWHGVDVYANGDDPSYTADDSGYGYQWQCVELVQRFYHQIIWNGYDSHWPKIGDAYGMFDLPDKDLQAVPDGSGQAPVWGDVLVFDQSDAWPSGHVAIVTQVAGGRVQFVQQNVGQYASDSLPIDGAHHVGVDGSSGVKYPPLRGWLHSPRNHGAATGNLGGYVANARSGVGVSGALVTLTIGGSTRVTTADGTGWYWFAAVPLGDASVSALAPGLEPGAAHVQVDTPGFAYAPLLELQSGAD